VKTSERCSQVGPETKWSSHGQFETPPTRGVEERTGNCGKNFGGPVVRGKKPIELG